MKKANRSSKIINFKDFNTGYNAVSEREDNIIGKKIADFRAANKMSLTDLRILLEIYGISITNASISKWETGASVPNIYQFIAVMQALGIDENISFFTRAAAQLNPEGLRKLREYRDDLIATGKYRVVAKHSYEEECIDMPIRLFPFRLVPVHSSMKGILKLSLSQRVQFLIVLILVFVSAAIVWSRFITMVKSHGFRNAVNCPQARSASLCMTATATSRCMMSRNLVKPNVTILLTVTAHSICSLF